MTMGMNMIKHISPDHAGSYSHTPPKAKPLSAFELPQGIGGARYRNFA